MFDAYITIRYKSKDGLSGTSRDIAVNVFEILHLLSDLLIGRKF